MAKQSKIVLKGISQEEFNKAFETYSNADAQEQVILAEIDLAINKIREKFQDDLDTLKKSKEQAFEVLQVYSTEQKDVLFTKKKSFETLFGTVGFRTGTPKLKTGKGMTWAACTELLSSFYPDYCRTVVEPNKEAIIAARDEEEGQSLLNKCKILCVQDESFFVEAKKERNA